MVEAGRTRFWLIGGGIIALLLYLLRAILLPFVAGMAVAYFLDPAVDKLEERGLNRTLATFIVTAVFFTVLITVVILLFPILQAQVVGFANNVPAYVERLRVVIWPLFEEAGAALSVAGIAVPDAAEVRDAAVGFAGEAANWIGGILRRFWSGGLALFNVISLLFITPIVAFYLLRDWDNMIARIDGLLPQGNADVIREQLILVDQAIAGFVRGQATVAMTLGIIYGLGWSLAGLEFGLVLGLGTGVLAFVPYVGAALGFVIALIVAFAQFGPEFTPLAMIIGTFAFGQTLDASFLTPKLVGGRVGLHPVWVIFALMAGGTLFGFLGVLIAVPTGAAIGVLVRYAASQYRISKYFVNGDGSSPEDTAS
ncbi:MAG: AI-2E family transporter [Alphaproteobacteria bacterium]|jgi:predicted PurR-regulated permease PerM|nr:AI-2E family transporter [Alphaproteobacteria bacterium]MBT4083866.1 AI-2E family transporter [Alphaproteobacteria bacterium]MBT4546168.1 AI-2E family transporter [Alphaproteobacteria bacterium]MBT7747592.1 AI-2E family transporter [Alphaproteobacteria bacterium]